MTWLNSLFGDSLPTGANLIVITVGLVLVLLLLFWLFRRIVGGNSIRGLKSRLPRLGVTEAAIIDDKRRLVLIRRDNVEHLVMIGGSSDVLVESNIIQASTKTAAETTISSSAMPAPIAAASADNNKARPAPSTSERKPLTPDAKIAATGAAIGAGFELCQSRRDRTR